MRIRALLLLAAIAAAAPAQDFDAIAKRVLPAPSEKVWEALDWQPTLWDGVIAAHQEKKPVLLWTMNGHPLGHT